MFFLVVDLHGDILVAALVAWGESLVHGFGIDKELEGGTRLVGSLGLVEFPCLEVYITHIGADGTSLRLHGHHGTVHEVHHIADRVERGHLLLYSTLVIVKELDHVGLVHVVRDRVGVIGIFSQELLVLRQSLGDVLNEMRHLVAILVIPADTFLVGSPFAVEVALNIFHLLEHSFLCVFLHLRVQCSVDLQTTAVEIITIFLAPVLEFVGNSLAEVHGLSIVVLLHFEMELDGDLL